MIKGEEGFITSILTQAVEDAKYTGFSKQDLEHKIESINWIMSGDPQFKYYCKLLNIEPSYIQNKIKNDTKITFPLLNTPFMTLVVVYKYSNQSW